MVEAKTEDFWVFGYGSLMWRPGFDFAESQPALLRGYHRSMCVLSTHYRGTADRPGLVLGLDRGGCCWGTVFRVPAPAAEQVRTYLHERELITNVYAPRMAAVTLADRRRVPAYCFVVRREHPQYVCDAETARLVALIRQGSGLGGTARDYLANTVAHLDQLGLRDAALYRLLMLVDGRGIA